MTFLFLIAYKYIKKGGNKMQDMDINKLLDMIAKMDKEELEKNLNKAQQILKSTDFKGKP